VSHIRTEPKHMLGLGKITDLSNIHSPLENKVTNTAIEDPQTSTDVLEENSFFNGDTCTVETNDQHNSSPSACHTDKSKADGIPVIDSNNMPKTWAALVKPSASPNIALDTPIVHNVRPTPSDVAGAALSSTFGSMSLGSKTNDLVSFNSPAKNDSDLGGQFSDAEDDDSFEIPSRSNNDENSESDSFEYCDGDEISDEECDVYIRDAEEVECKEMIKDKIASPIVTQLDMEFPSLTAVSAVPYDGSDDEEGERRIENARQERLLKKEEEDKRKREASLQPISKDGKIFNSFRKYKHILSTSGLVEETKIDRKAEKSVPNKAISDADASASMNSESKNDQLHSRVIGGVAMSGQGTEVDDDGEGWISSTKEIAAMKATGKLHPSSKPSNDQHIVVPDLNSPSNNCRAACATTDFAMQNVILQMNLELLSVDGVKVRRLKSWVTRCAACFKVYTGSENDGKRLFCGQCGSDRLQRVAASVDGKTGRLRLHLRKDYRHNKRGTKYTLPDPGKGNQFMGDLLLREDQLLYGAWNQRMKQSKSNKGKESIFGSDVASTVGCHADLTKRDDICVGFGRKNPNASKFGRERRGKKKKSTDKVCGLRRY